MIRFIAAVLAALALAAPVAPTYLLARPWPLVLWVPVGLRGNLDFPPRVNVS